MAKIPEGWVWRGRTCVTHPNWPQALNSKSWLPALTRFNFPIGISWKSCTFPIRHPSMSPRSVHRHLPSGLTFLEAASTK